MEIRSFGHHDVPQAKRLSDAAGWNQTEGDWHRIVALQPDGCLGAWVDGQLVGTTTFVRYGENVAWVGMVLVLPACRGQGYGSSLFEAALKALDERDVSLVGLDATEAGQSLYERADFRPVAPILRWRGRIDTSGRSSRPIRCVGPDRLRAVTRFDRRHAGLDRAPLLERLAREDDVAVLVLASEDESLRGYACVRPGRTAWHIGPLVAERLASAEPLLRSAARYLDGREVLVDSAKGFGFSEVLEAAGLKPSRRLTRMTAPTASSLLTGPSLVAATGFEWG